MHKKILAAACLSAAALALAVLVRGARKPSPVEDALQRVARIEAALDDSWERQSTTVASPAVYRDAAGNTLVYYLCRTVYHAADPADVAGLNLAALQSVLDPDAADSSRSCSVNGLDAMLYEKGGRRFLCWTLSPEYTCVLEYSPDAVTEADIFKMAESVPVCAAPPPQ